MKDLSRGNDSRKCYEYECPGDARHRGGEGGSNDVLLLGGAMVERLESM